MSVILGHCLLQTGGLALWSSKVRDFPAMAWTDIVLRSLYLVFPSDAAVTVFFVLSGHVLWTSFRRKRLVFFADLPDYACSRLYRLLPVAIMSGLPIGLLTAARADDLVMNMLLLHRDMNGVLWSLQVEVVASLVLFAVWGLTRGQLWKVLATLILSLVAFRFVHGSIYVAFFPAFILGALISSVSPRVWRNPWLLTASVVVLVGTNLVIGRVASTPLFEMAASMVLVGAVASGRLPALGSGLAHFLGAISYPFYLVQAVGLAGANALLGLLPALPLFGRLGLLAVFSVCLTIPLAWFLHVAVEGPAQRGRPRFGRAA